MSQIKKQFTKDRYWISYPVPEEFDGARLDQLLMHYLPNFSRQQIKKKITSGDITIVGRPHPHKPSTKVYLEEQVELVTMRDDLEDEYWRGEKLELEEPKVVFEDDDLLVISKPPYMSTHPAGKHLFNCATVYFETLYGHTVHSIHRLDRETSGILLLAKNPKTANLITPLFEEKRIQKAYFFIAHKIKQDVSFPFEAKERLGQKTGFLPRQFMHCWPENSSEGKASHTSFEKIGEDENFILGLAFPRTGRQHQIRSHAHFHGLSLVGDKMYGDDPTIFMRFKDMEATEADHDAMLNLSRHALHALAIRFEYLNKEQVFVASLPEDLTNWLKINFNNQPLIENLDRYIRAALDRLID